VPRGTSPPWLARRLFPLLAAVILVAVGMFTTTWGAELVGRHAWPLPGDLWGTLVAARRLVHLDLAGLYTRPTGLVTFPGAAVILAPVAAVIGAAGLGFAPPGPHNPQPGTWLLAGPYQIALSAIVLFAADAVAERLGADRPRRAVLAGAGAIALWNVSVRWGHPEDAVSVALLLYGFLALAGSRTGRAGWLVGAAVAVQPLVLLALPVLLVMAGPRRLAGFLARAAVPAAVLLAAAAAANPAATIHVVTSQPNWPAIDHATPWTSLAPHLARGAVAAGPFRVIAIVLACGCAFGGGIRWRAARKQDEPGTEALADLLWWMAAALALRCVFEPVMVAYYLWPVLAIALVAASPGWFRLVAAGVVAGALTFGSQAPSRGPWLWWAAVVAGLALLLLFARVRYTGRRGAREALGG
jgi:hypothetical protein